MAGSERDTGGRKIADRSLNTLLVMLGVTGSLAGSMIVIAYASAGAQSMHAAGATSDIVTQPEAEAKTTMGDRPSHPEREQSKPASPDFTSYIDSLLANQLNDKAVQNADFPAHRAADGHVSVPSEEEQAGNAADNPPKSQGSAKPSASTDESIDKSAPSGTPQDEPADKETTIVQRVLGLLDKLA